MKIDLHCHTKKVKKGDPVSRNVDVETFAKKVSDADVKILAITNHNEFDYDQYKLFQCATEGYCKIWPGIELDIQDVSKKKWHLIIVSNPAKVHQFYEKVQNMMAGKDKDKVLFTINEVVGNFDPVDVLYIPHYHKEPAIPEQDLKSLFQLLPENYRIFLELSNTRSLGVFANYQYKVIVGSDVKDWEHYENCNFAELRLPVESFEQFILLAKRDAVNVETLLNKSEPISVTVSPHSTIKFPLKIYQEVNIIFGQKGTGKTEILKSMQIELQNKGKKCVSYFGTKRDEDFRLLLSTSDMRRNLFFTNTDNKEADLKNVLEWQETTPTAFSEYLDWYETLEKNKNKSRMRITNAVQMTIPQKSQYIKAKNDFDTANALAHNSEKIRLDAYLNATEMEMFNQLLLKIIRGAKTKTIEEYIHNKAIVLANKSVDWIKRFADKRTNTKSIPSTTGFYEYAMNRLRLKESITAVNGTFFLDTKRTSQYIGTLEDKGKVYITSVYKMLDSSSRTTEFEIGIRTLKEIKDILIEIHSNIYSMRIAEKIHELNIICKSNNIRNMEAFVGLSKVITTENKEEYNPSNGEKGILLLQHALEEDADVYLIDEPELGMGNSYIDQCIRPKISDLGKQRKIVVVATHNANIAVRTLPYQSIFRRYQTGRYQTFTGNPFTNVLVDIIDHENKLSWKDESLHTLEGGREAFYEREYIYGSSSHQC